MLKWAGGLTEPFQPNKLVVDPSNGYVYHPSPQPSRRKRSKGDEVDRYGALSLLGSNLVLSGWRTGWRLILISFAEGLGGSIEWKGGGISWLLLDANDAAIAGGACGIYPTAEGVESSLLCRVEAILSKQIV